MGLARVGETAAAGASDTQLTTGTQNMVSVVMPAYNRGYIIAESIASVLRQTYRDFELIIIDDGSQDDTRQVVSRFTDPRIRYLRHEQNRGCSAAYNTGLAQAAGQFVAILDSDDLWKPERLAKALDFLYRHPETDVVFTDFEKLSASEFTPSHVRRWCPRTSALLAARGWPKETIFTQKEMHLILLQEFPLVLQSTLMRRAARERTGFLNESWSSASDWNFILRSSAENRFGYIDEPLSVLRLQADATHHLHGVEGHALCLRMLRDEMRRAPDAEARHAATLGYSYHLRQLSRALLERGKRWKACQALLRGFFVTGRFEFLARAAYALFQGRK